MRVKLVSDIKGRIWVEGVRKWGDGSIFEFMRDEVTGERSKYVPKGSTPNIRIAK
jgi:hypothetical protein